MVKPIEKKYQSAAHRRNVEDRKFNFYSETAKYFERECDKAKQFNLWNVDKLKHTHWENLKKLNALKLRQHKLQELVNNEDKIYEEECKNLERKNTKKELSFEELTNQLKERRAELNLYKPRTFRRIESYFLYPTQIDHQRLKEHNKSLTHNFNNSTNSTSGSNRNNSSMEDSTQNQKDFEERSDACQQNRVNSEFAQYQHFYDVEQSSQPLNASKCMNELRGKKHHNSVNDDDSKNFAATAKRYSPNFLYGHQMYINEENNPILDKKFKQRNSHQSLVNTNISNKTSMYSFDLCDDVHKKQNNCDEIKLSEDTDKNFDTDFDMSKSLDKVDSVEVEENDKITSANEMSSNEQFEDTNYNKGKNEKKTSVQLSGHLEVDSESMLMYLRDNTLKEKIRDLEMREHRASMKHLWDESLRLRDMRNRLELFREKQIYQRYDSQIDPKDKEDALKNIETRTKQLKDRETICADSGLYSEEAKRTWNQWVEEDENSLMNNSHDLKDILVKKLEEEWLQLTENDRKVFCQMYNNITTDSNMQFETQLLVKKGIN